MTTITNVEYSGAITVNGVEYVRKADKPTGTRAIIVVDRGWIFAGDVTRENGPMATTTAMATATATSTAMATATATAMAMATTLCLPIAVEDRPI